MAERLDILVDDDDDLIIDKGDFVIDMSNYQHIKHILQAAPGHYKQWPLLGANIIMMKKGSFDGEMRRNISLQIQADGYDSNKIKFIDNIIEIDATI